MEHSNSQAGSTMRAPPRQFEVRTPNADGIWCKMPSAKRSNASQHLHYKVLGSANTYPHEIVQMPSAAPTDAKSFWGTTTRRPGTAYVTQVSGLQ